MLNLYQELSNQTNKLNLNYCLHAKSSGNGALGVFKNKEIYFTQWKQSML